MKLLWSSRSPFVRKVCITACELGIADQVEQVPTHVTSTVPAAPEILAINPLGKLPALICDDGQRIFDSRVICEYLNTKYSSINTPMLFPAEAEALIRQLRWQALADGITDILLLWRTELARGRHTSEDLTTAYEIKIRASMAHLSREAQLLSSSSFGIGHIACICTLEYLDFRWPGTHWHAHFNALADWLNDMRSRPSVAATAYDDKPTTASNPVFSFEDS